MDKVCILGTGKQGTAAAYDLLLYAKPKKMILLDSIEISLKSCLSKIESVKSSKTEIVLQSPNRVKGMIVFFFTVTLTQILLVLKKKQFEKVQAAEMNF